MNAFMLTIVTLIYFGIQAKPKEILITKGMVITTSITVKKAIYHLNADSPYQVITITGNNITVDFNGAELKGSNDKEWPDQFYGLGILIKGGRNIILKNAIINGFKI